jgi:hypothetical protein
MNAKRSEMTKAERAARLAELESHYHITTAEYIAAVELLRTIDGTHTAEWLILAQRGELV